MKRFSFSIVASALILFGATGAQAQQQLKFFEDAIPRSPREFTAKRTATIIKSADEIQRWIGQQTWGGPQRDPEKVLAKVHLVVNTKQRVDACLDEVLAFRGQFTRMRAGEQRREHIRQFLQTTSAIIGLSGHVRYLLRDAIDNASYDLTPHPDHLDRLINYVSEQRVEIAAMVMRYALFDPPPASRVQPFPLAVKKRVLRLAAATKQTDLLYDLGQMLRQKDQPAELMVEVADTIRTIGVPQDPLTKARDDQPAITAGEVRDILRKVDTSESSAALRKQHRELIAWFENRARRGVTGDVFRFGNLELRAGDWLLMRNPSPYNMFTDIAPGLFTHVGVVSTHTDAKGVRRFVLVDLPERGSKIPQTPVDNYLRRTLHYFFLRHPDQKIQAKMSEAAASMVGNDTEFDLTFRTERVLALKGKSLKGRRINTYCAGFLLLCAQYAGAPRKEFFPIPEYQAGGNCARNLKTLGLSIGKDFVSPSGAIFSPNLEIVARREPMYSPGREVKEVVYDYFARAMVDKILTPSPNTFQSLREKLAGFSKTNPLLAKAMAAANNVSANLDLVAAAKAAAVIETLDEIADANRDGFFEARQAFMAGPVEYLSQRGFEATDIERVKRYRTTHQGLYLQWTRREITPRDLRIKLVKFYQEQGKTALDERFFDKEKAPLPGP